MFSLAAPLAPFQTFDFPLFPTFDRSTALPMPCGGNPARGAARGIRLAFKSVPIGNCQSRELTMTLLTPPRLLITDDDRDFRETVAGMLSDRGFETIQAAD